MNHIEYNAETIHPQAEYLLTDSRQVSFPAQSIFFAIKGTRNDGHQHIDKLYQKGVRNFVLENESFTTEVKSKVEQWQDAHIWVVKSSITALQKMAIQHRQQFNIPILGITGSNGKTIVKEWLTQLLSPDQIVVSNPKSYNSQIGVPISIWNITKEHQIGIFEAGISQAHEMEYIEPIIQPTFGIFTNIGTAHDYGFKSSKQKIAEKLRLFRKVNELIYRKDYADLHEEITLILKPVNAGIQLTNWSTEDTSSDIFVKYTKNNKVTSIAMTGQLGKHSFITEFRDEASLENLTHCIVYLLIAGLTPSVIQNRISRLRSVSMRLELKEGINRSYIIDDTYNNDVNGLSMALNFLTQLDQFEQKTVIISDVLQTGQKPEKLYATIGALIKQKGITKLIGIGPDIFSQSSQFDLPDATFFKSTSEFLAQFPFASIHDNLILVKGARDFEFEKIVYRLQQKAHRTVLEINLDALTHNLNYYRSKVGPQTKLMAMVKAFAYGSGSAEVANLLQYNHIDYLGVAYTDEGVMLRQNGITVPIMVMNADIETFDLLWKYQLEPELYSRSIILRWIDYCKAQSNPMDAPAVHLKLDTGMHRLGFVEDDYSWLTQLLSETPSLKVASIFSHLVGADEGKHNEFSRSQYAHFIYGAERIEKALGYSVLKHILNSAGIIRFPEYKMDMVRLGIGLYGVEATGYYQSHLQEVSTLKTVVSQIKYLTPGQTVGYSRNGHIEQNTATATIAIGYADGYDRGLGNGVGKVWINGHLCPTVGNICMDMTMVDVTNLDVQEGNEVIVFGKEIAISELADKINTIPYELLTGIGPRVKRIFYKG
jgi:alanine racemase